MANTNSLSSTQCVDLAQREAEMHATDRLVLDTEERKNALEEYVYDMRDKLEMRYSEFATDSVSDALNMGSSYIY